MAGYVSRIVIAWHLVVPAPAGETYLAAPYRGAGLPVEENEEGRVGMDSGT